MCVQFPRSAFGANVLTVVSRDKLGPARSWGTVDNDFLPDTFTSAADPDTNVGQEGIGHDGTPATVPHICVVPILFPSPHALPGVVGHKLVDALPDGSYPSDFTMFDAGMKFLKSKNNGESIHSGTAIFNATNWDANGIGRPIVEAITDGLMNDIADLGEWVPPGSLPVAACAYQMDEAKCAKLRAFTDTLAPSAPANANPPQPAAALDPIVISTLVKEAYVAAATIKDKGSQDAKDLTSAMDSWRVVFAEQRVDPTTGEKVAVPATLCPEFVSALGDKGDNRARRIQNLFEAKLTEQKLSRTSVGTRAKIVRGQPDKVMCTLFAKFQVMSGPLSAYNHNFDAVFSLFNLLRIDPNDPDYCKRVSTDIAYQRQVLHEDDPKKRPKAPTRAYVEGSQLERDDHLVAAYNLLLFALIVAITAKFSFAYEIIDLFVQTYEQTECLEWVGRHHVRHPHIMHNLVAKLQDCFGVFLKLGSNPELLRLAAAGENLPIAGFIAATDHAKNGLYQMNLDLKSNNLGRLGERPFTFSWFPRHMNIAATVPGYDHTQSNVLGKRGSVQETDANKLQRLTPPDLGNPTPGNHLEREQRNKEKNKGILVTRDRKKPQCMESIGRKKRRFCAMNVYEGVFCRYGPRCNFTHVDHFSELSDRDAKIMCKFVDDTPTVSFTENSGARCPQRG